MSDKTIFFYDELVTSEKVNTAFDQLEAADRNIIVDYAMDGVADGLEVTENSPEDMTVLVSAGVAYTDQGKRCYVSAQQEVDCTVDSAGSAIALPGGGQTKWLSLFILFNEVLSDVATDGNDDSVYQTRTESFTLHLVQGSAGVGPARPSLISHYVLLADILLTNGMTTIDTATNVDTSRRQTASQGALATHIADTVGAHAASAISYLGSGNWADGSALTATNVETALDEIVTDLGNAVVSVNGAGKIGFYPQSGIAANNVEDALVELSTECARLADNETVTGDWTLSGTTALTGTVAVTNAIAFDGAYTAYKMFDGIYCDDAYAAKYFKSGSNTLPVTETFHVFPIHLPDGCSLKQVRMRIDPTTATEPETTRAQAIVQRIDNTGALTTVFSVEEDALTGASYRAEHDFDLPAVAGSHTIDNQTYRYQLVLYSEVGSGAEADIDLKSIRFQYTTSAYRKANG